jgi:hypothetical protein
MMNTPTDASRPMTDGEYALKREEGEVWFCPRCRSLDIVDSALQWEGPEFTESTALVRLQCNACQTRWTEILRPVGYEIEEDESC